MSPSSRLPPGMIEEQDAVEKRVGYNVLLKKLKVAEDYGYFTRLIEHNDEWTRAQKRARIKRLNDFLDELDDFIKVLKKNDAFNRAQIILWMKLFQNPNEIDINIDNLFDKSGKFIACYRGYIIIALNFLSLALNLLTKHHADIEYGVMGTKISDNFFSVIDSLLTGAKQCHDGEVLLGSANILSGIQRLALSLTSLIGNKLVGSATVPILGSASLIAGLLLSIGVETLQIHRSQDRIRCISRQIESSQDQTQAEKLNQLLIVEYANLDTHEQNLKGLSVTLLCITVALILSFTVLSGLSFGAVPAATILLAATAFVVNALRTIWLKSKSANKKLKSSTQLIAGDDSVTLETEARSDEQTVHLNNAQLNREANIIDKWNKLIINLISDGRNPRGEYTFNNGNTVSFLRPIILSNSFLTKTRITFKQYIDRIFIKYPEKGQAIITALEQKNYVRFQEALAMRQHPFIDNVKKSTTGCKLLRQLTVRPASEDGLALGT